LFCVSLKLIEKERVRWRLAWGGGVVFEQQRISVGGFIGDTGRDDTFPCGDYAMAVSPRQVTVR